MAAGTVMKSYIAILTLLLRLRQASLELVLSVPLCLFLCCGADCTTQSMFAWLLRFFHPTSINLIKAATYLRRELRFFNYLCRMIKHRCTHH